MNASSGEVQLSLLESDCGLARLEKCSPCDKDAVLILRI